jgi:hypothetical protein
MLYVALPSRGPWSRGPVVRGPVVRGPVVRGPVVLWSVVLVHQVTAFVAPYIVESKSALRLCYGYMLRLVPEPLGLGLRWFTKLRHPISKDFKGIQTKRSHAQSLSHLRLTSRNFD